MIRPGSRLAHYEVVSSIGKGGMGEVWRARDTKLGREVAIKTLPDEFADDAERLARFEREAKLLASLNHPNIAAIHGLEESGQTRFLVLELVEGDTLADRLKQGAIPVDESLKLALQIAEALEAAHEKGVIHRDLKPANIKITPDGRVKVLDFGLAKALIGEQADVNLSTSPTLSMAATQAGIILGTAAYMSPEQASGAVADHRADVWAFGVVLYEMLTGRQLFTGKTAAHVMGAVLERQPDWETLPPDLHPAVRELVERCLEKDVKDRRQTVTDVRVDLRKVLAEAGRGVVPRSATVDQSAMSPRAWVAVLVAAVISGLAGWMLAPRPVGEAHGVVRVPFVLPDGQLMSGGLQATAIDVSRDGRMIAYTVANQIWVKALDSEEPRLVQGVDVPALFPRFSPDGLSIVYLTTIAGEWALRRVQIAGGAPVTVWAGLVPPAPEWNADDTIFFSQLEGIMRVAATGGEPVLVVEAAEGEILASPRLVPNGDVLYTAGVPGNWDQASIFVQSPGEDDRTLVWEGGGDAQYVATGHLVYAQGNALFAVPFDLDRREATGGATSIVEGALRSTSGESPTGQYAISDNGTFVQIAPFGATSLPTSILAYAGRDGTIEEIDLPAGSYGHPRVSPDGSRIVFEVTGESGETDLWIYDRDGLSQPVRLTRGGNNSRPIWSRDSEYVTFTSTRGGGSSIWRQRADFREAAEQLTTPDGAEHWPDAWSPDGNTLLFTRFGGATDQTVQTLTPEDGAGPVPFTETEQAAGGAAFSPGGDWIAYRGMVDPGDAASVQIFVKPFPLSGPEIQVSLNGGSHPIFSSDGTELYYRRASPVAAGPPLNEFVGIDISTEGRVTYGVERVIPVSNLPARFGIRDYDVIPDEDRFLVMLPGADADPATVPQQEIKIVLNWREELVERVPVP